MRQRSADVIPFPQGAGHAEFAYEARRPISSMELDDAFSAFQQAVMSEIRAMRPYATHEEEAPIPDNWQEPPRGRGAASGPFLLG